MSATLLISASAAALVAAGIAAAAMALPADRAAAAKVSPPASNIQVAQAVAPQPPDTAQPQPAPTPPAAATQSAPASQPGLAPAAQPDPAAAARQSDAEVVITLLRSTLVALHQANVTGNYTVLRDISAPGFRDKNSAADLARIFAPIRDAGIDLSAAVLLDPHIARTALNNQKMLNIVGSLETKPLPVSFELIFQPVQGVWRVYGISVMPIKTIADAPKPQAPKAAAKPPPKAKRARAPKAMAPDVVLPAPAGDAK